MKVYREICEDLIMMLEDLEGSLEEIAQMAEPSEPKPAKNEAGLEISWLERHFDFTLKR